MMGLQCVSGIVASTMTTVDVSLIYHAVRPLITETAIFLANLFHIDFVERKNDAIEYCCSSLIMFPI